MAPQAALAGRTLGGRYEILDLLGVGGMGEVYRARDRELDELVAMKVIREDLVELPGVLDQFRSEVKLARRVTHRNVARAYELGRADGVTYYTMELVEGGSLSRRMTGRPIHHGRSRRDHRRAVRCTRCGTRRRRDPSRPQA